MLTWKSFVVLSGQLLIVLARERSSYFIPHPIRAPVMPLSPILVTHPINGDMMFDGIPTVSIDEVCSRTINPPRYCEENDPLLPIPETCDTIIRAGYIPKGCDGAYMHPTDRRDYCDALNRADQAEPHYCFIHNDIMHYRTNDVGARNKKIKIDTNVRGDNKFGNDNEDVVIKQWVDDSNKRSSEEISKEKKKGPRGHRDRRNKKKKSDDSDEYEIWKRIPMKRKRNDDSYEP